MFKKGYLFSLMTVVLVITISVPIALAYSKGAFIKQGMGDSYVAVLQRDLETHEDLITSKTNIQSPDIVSDIKTIGNINSLKKAKAATVSKRHVTRKSISRGGNSRRNEIQLLPWFNKVDKLFGIGDVATVIDVATGLRIQVKRTYGYNHADVEALTTKDTETLEKVAGGSWNWTRRPVIVEFDGYRIAASITAMPHAGRDDMQANKVVSDRSGGFGSGVNLDTIKGNGMDGHFDIHFYGSKTHNTNSVDAEHQAAIQEAYKSGK